MRVFQGLGLFALGSAISAAAQSSCTPQALNGAANDVAAIRKQLHGEEVAESDPKVPPAVATQLGDLKSALATAAQAAFACAAGTVTAEALQKTLADALHANLANATETVETRKGMDIGAYGSDLSVQVFQLFGRPKLFEVDFRYGVECGDDNLLLVFEAPDDSAASRWRERLRWGAPSYTTVADALGDFVMLTPLTGSYKTPTWRFIVAHGHPGCGRLPRQSRFDLDLLSPTADPASPHVDWHFDHGYTQGKAVPRLATTEDTVDFRVLPEQEAHKPGVPPKAAAIYRFHLAPNGQLEPSSDTADEDSAGSAATRRSPATTSSPQ